MKTLECIGKSVEEAIQKGLLELKVSEDKVDVKVISYGSKGIFGIGYKPARVLLTLKNDYATVAKVFLKELLDKMGIKCEINIKDEVDTLKVDLLGPDMGILIGYRGETLDSIQYLLSLIVNKSNKSSDYKKVIVDTENYRKKREETLIRLANRLAFKVKKYNKSITLEPMNPYERRVIHAALQSNPFVTTHSEGDEPFRKVVIDIKR